MNLSDWTGFSSIKREFLVIAIRSGFLAFLIASASLLAGCAAKPPRNAELDKSFRKVAVVSLLPETAPVIRTGLTVFNNARKTVDLENKANARAQALVSERLNQLRPDLDVVRPDLERRAWAEKFSKARDGEATRAVMAELGNQLAPLGVDAIWLVQGVRSEYHPFDSSGIWLRPMTLSTPEYLGVHAEMCVALLDGKGKPLGYGCGGYGVSSAGMKSVDLGITYELDTVDKPEVASKIRTVLMTQMDLALRAGMASLGY